MRLFLTVFRTCPKFVNWLLMLSVGTLLLKVLLLDDLPGLFPKAHEIGGMVNDLLVANIAGYIFFILSAQLPKVLELRGRGREVLNLAERAANDVTGFLQMLYNHNMPHHLKADRILNIESVSLEIVKREFALVSPVATAPMSDGALASRLSWLGAMAIHDLWFNRTISKFWKRYPFFDVELSSLIVGIENSPHSAGMLQARELTPELLKNGGTIQNTDLTTWSWNYYECYEKARDLINYCRNFRNLYGIG